MSAAMATRAPPPRGASLGVPPNQTLYVKNLPDSLKKPDLRRNLYMLFSTFGPILDIIALKTMKMRGQAHIVFRDVQCAAQAMRALNGFEFFGKEMKVQYARSKSQTVAKLDGTFKIPAAAAVQTTELQQSIFNSLPAGRTEVPISQAGTKRRRDDEEDDEDVPMEDDEGSAMEESEGED
ncbi:RNA-binding domain-containing protein [Trichodelitschia bisporula]|uniref:RNA-binding domain-containing protein n=1 Tax=Trichodelitschia bisporula TaxID=703511 RepID=A0A6G1IA81_9PEZI|nr:RNA-binding domain-containing protein [Trichodelitschia bisporula]